MFRFAYNLLALALTAFLLPLLLLLSTPVNGVGINCHGSARCLTSDNMGVMEKLAAHMARMHDRDVYMPGQSIACFYDGWSGFYCAFVQGKRAPRGGVYGVLLKEKMRQLVEHGCRGCGSVPLAADNESRTSGLLTVNFVMLAPCTGLCWPVLKYSPPATATAVAA